MNSLLNKPKVEIFTPPKIGEFKYNDGLEKIFIGPDIW
jgi:hypothetical protein